MAYILFGYLNTDLSQQPPRPILESGTDDR